MSMFFNDIFCCPADALVNPVNCIGVAGKGLALEFKKRFNASYLSYRAACREGHLDIGRVFICRDKSLMHEFQVRPRYIINFPTKFHWQDKSSLEIISRGLDSMIENIVDINELAPCERDKIYSVAIPALGCGEGGLSWNEVEPLIHQKIEPLKSDIEFFILGPHE